MARNATGQVVELRRARGVVYALRFRAYGKREYVTTHAASRAEAEFEPANVLADVRRGIWKPSAAPVVEAPREEPTFHELASAYVGRRRHEVDERTVENWTWALSCHLLPFFADSLPSAINAAAIERYKTAKLRERERLEAKLAEWEKADPDRRGRRPPRPLANEGVNRTLKTLAMVLDDGVDFGYIESNPARGRKRRLKASKPRRTWLELDELQALLDAIDPDRRGLLATMALAGLWVSEACGLRWRDLDLANGRLRVADSKTDAGVRQVELTPMLRDELLSLKASRDSADPGELVFPTKAGTARDRNNVRSRVLAPAVARANARLAEVGRPPLQPGITNHTLRRTFCALLFEAGASPAYAMQQMGHANAALALEVYSKVMERKRDTGARMDALLRGADWAPMGTNGDSRADVLAAMTTEGVV
jgi:integrase